MPLPLGALPSSSYHKEYILLFTPIGWHYSLVDMPPPSGHECSGFFPIALVKACCTLLFLPLTDIQPSPDRYISSWYYCDSVCLTISWCQKPVLSVTTHLAFVSYCVAWLDSGGRKGCTVNHNSSGSTTPIQTEECSTCTFVPSGTRHKNVW